MSTETYRIPDFLSLFPEKRDGEINPHFKGAETAFNAWVKTKLSGSLAEELYQCNAPLWVSMMYPFASYQQLKGIIDYMIATLLIDDIIDRSPKEEALILSQSRVKVLRDGNEAESVEHPLIEMMRCELLSCTKAAVGSFYWPQFVSVNEMALMCMVEEALERGGSPNRDATPNIQSYSVKRRGTIALPPCFILARSTRSLYIPDDVLANPVVQEMENATSDMGAILNDVYSFKKEYAFNGAENNLLTVMLKDPETAHLDFQGRLDHSGKLFEAAVERFHACRQELLSRGTEMDQQLSLYADAMIDIIVGALHWSRVSGRYSTFMNDEDRKNNVIRLALDRFPVDENHVSVC